MNLGRLAKCFALLFLVASVSATPAKAETWPALPSSGYLAGRLAVEADMKSGNAIFMSKVGGASAGRAAAIAIPQFAYIIGEDGLRTPAVVVQAENSEVGTIVGLRDAAGAEYVVTLGELQLLGKSHP